MIRHKPGIGGLINGYNPARTGTQNGYGWAKKTGIIAYETGIFKYIEKRVRWHRE